MPRFYQYRATTGALIIGTLDLIQGRANLTAFDEDGNPDWSGETTMFWDSQESMRRESGEVIYLDDTGDEWTLAECTREENSV